MKTLSILGCGTLGRTLARLWQLNGVVQIQDILNRTPASAEAAAAFIGAGRPVSAAKELRPAEVVLIGSPDAEIRSCARILLGSAALTSKTLVFHCSGGCTVEELVDLAPLQESLQLSLASAHPAQSFADPEQACRQFAGTHVAIEVNIEVDIEAESHATEVLSSLFRAIGGVPFRIRSQDKARYHAALCILSNYLPALIETGLGELRASGLTSETSQRISEPLVRGTLENVFSLGTVKALTGPIARGDVATIRRHLVALGQSSNSDLSAREPSSSDLYRLLGRVALKLAAKQSHAAMAELEEIRKLLIQT